MRIGSPSAYPRFSSSTNTMPKTDAATFAAKPKLPISQLQIASAIVPSPGVVAGGIMAGLITAVTKLARR